MGIESPDTQTPDDLNVVWHKTCGMTCEQYVHREKVSRGGYYFKESEFEDALFLIS